MSTIRTLVISDTHNEWPYSAKNPSPKVDVFIHCGDLTEYGGLPSFRRAIDSIKTIDADLKLFIAGNHDVDIDQAWLKEFAEDDDDVEIGARCVSFLKSQQTHNIHYLEEGTRSFTLKDGWFFTVYATPYTPKFGEFAFLYGEDEDRFNDGPNAMPEGVDIVISHGPPAFPAVSDYKLDVSKRGGHCGCEKLAKALERVRPRFACFGHIHEGRGAAKIDWISRDLSETAGIPDIVVSSGSKGLQTTLINSAVFGDEAGWIVDFEL